MLPGFRFIFMTLLLGTSVVIFGLGAAALLRATHEEFANMPTLRTLQQPVPPTFAERFPPAAPAILSLLQVEPQVDVAPRATAESDTASLKPQGEMPTIKSKPHSAKPIRKRSSKLKRPRSRSVIAHKRRLSAQRAARARYAQMQMRQELFPSLFGNAFP